MRKFVISVFLWVVWIPVIQASDIPLQKETEDPLEHYISKALSLVYNDFSQTMVYLKKADSLAGLSQEPVKRSRVAHSFGLAYYVKGEYGLSLEYFLKAGEIYRELGDKIGMAKALIGRGLIQQGIDRHSEAVALFKQAIDTYNEAEEPEQASPAYLNIAISEVDLNQYEAARENLELALKLSRVSGRQDVEHMSLNKLGQLSLLEGDPETAIRFHNKVLFDTTEPSSWEKSFAYGGLAEAFQQRGIFSMAEEHALVAMKFASETGSLWDLERNSKILSNVYTAMDSTGKAFEYLKLNQEFKDSLYNQEKLREINLLQLESKESENKILLAEKVVAEKRLFINRVFTFLLVLLILFLVLLLVLFYKKRRQKEKFHRELKRKNKTILEQNEVILKRNAELDEINRSKDRFFSILSHDLKSPIGSIQQLLEMMKSGDFTQEEQSALLDEMLKQISGTSFMLHNLLYWASSQLENSKNAPESLTLPAEVEKVLRAYYWPAKQKNISVTHKAVPGLSKIWVDKAQLAVILNNLISNAIKYTVEGKGIEISYQDQGSYLQLIVSDGGVGMSREKIHEISGLNTRVLSERGTGMETGTGLGLLLVKQFLQANQAKMEIESEPGEGSQFKISFVKAS